MDNQENTGSPFASIQPIQKKIKTRIFFKWGQDIIVDDFSFSPQEVEQILKSTATMTIAKNNTMVAFRCPDISFIQQIIV